VPNYLARVAAAGMRTSISTKPPVAGPPILPGHRPPSFTVATGIEQGEGQVIQHDVEEEQVVPALPSATVALNKPMSPSVPESTQPEDQVPSTKDATPFIQAPRALRPVYTAHPASSQLHQEQAAHPGVSTLPVPSAGTTMSSSTTPTPIAPSIKEPTAKEPVMAGVSLSLAQENAPPMPPAQPTSRQVRLTIGQVDVQVNNRPPAPPISRSPSTGSPAVTDALEQRYLDRFQLKP